MNVFFIFLPRGQGDNIIGNYIRVDTDFILKDNFRQFGCQLFLSRHTARTICLIRIAHSSVRQFKEDFVFALMKCSNAAFGEQNKIDNDSKCQQVYKSHIINLLNLIYFYVKLQPQHREARPSHHPSLD